MKLSKLIENIEKTLTEAPGPDYPPYQRVKKGLEMVAKKIGAKNDVKWMEDAGQFGLEISRSELSKLQRAFEPMGDEDMEDNSLEAASYAFFCGNVPCGVSDSLFKKGKLIVFGEI